MAVVYSMVGGRKLTKLIALHEQVQRRVDEEALFGGQKAEGYLLHHRHSGAARIDIEKGRVDSYVVLDDERGLKAALSIEYGRKEVTDDDGNVIQNAAPGLFVLHRAFGLRHTKLPTAAGGDNLNE